MLKPKQPSFHFSCNQSQSFYYSTMTMMLLFQRKTREKRRTFETCKFNQHPAHWQQIKLSCHVISSLLWWFLSRFVSPWFVSHFLRSLFSYFLWACCDCFIFCSTFIRKAWLRKEVMSKEKDYLRFLLLINTETTGTLKSWISRKEFIGSEKFSVIFFALEIFMLLFFHFFENFFKTFQIILFNYFTSTPLFCIFFRIFICASNDWGAGSQLYGER